MARKGLDKLLLRSTEGKRCSVIHTREITFHYMSVHIEAFGREDQDIFERKRTQKRIKRFRHVFHSTIQEEGDSYPGLTLFLEF